MKKNIIICFSLTLLLFSCKSEKGQYTFIEGTAQGATYHITFENKELKDYSIVIDSFLNAFDKSLSIYDSTSLISKINSNCNDLMLDDWFIKVFNKSVVINKLTDGAFDITVGPICNAWGFGNTPYTKVDSASIDSLLQFVGMSNVSINDQKLVKLLPGVKLDFNALAQGYAVDIICDFFEEEGIENYLIEIGGELRAKGKNAKDNYWKIGIDRPDDNNNIAGENLQAILEIKDKAVATSGNYRRFFVENGVKYSHIINPKTGYPARSNLLSVTVISDKCIDADALATSFMVLGFEKSKTLVKQLPDIDVLFIYSNENGEYQVFYTEGLKKMLVE